MSDAEVEAKVDAELEAERREAEAEMAVPFERWVGLPSEGVGMRGRALGGGEEVRGVGLGCTMLSAALWSRLGGLNTSMPTLYAALDLGLRAAADESLSTVYVAASSVASTASPSGREAGEEGGGEHSMDPPSVLHSMWSERWGVMGRQSNSGPSTAPMRAAG